jgi:hypothetical protein
MVEMAYKAFEQAISHCAGVTAGVGTAADFERARAAQRLKHDTKNLYDEYVKDFDEQISAAHKQGMEKAYEAWVDNQRKKRK